MKKIFHISFLFLVFPLFSFTPGNDPVKKNPSGDGPIVAFNEIEGLWAQQTLETMTLDEKIGQLFMMAAYSRNSKAESEYIEGMIRKFHIGGLIFMQGGPGRQRALANRFQEAAKIPLMIAQDSEWGLNMRLDSTLYFPKNMTLGAIRDDSLIYELGKEIGRQCRAVGVQVNFSPVVDVNNNPDNPVINDRSFGENKINVANKGIMMMKGMEAEGVMACAKHFPGHGDTDTDSHKDLPIINHDLARLDSIELYPFRKMIAAGVQTVMVAHLYIPSLDATPNQASTLSKKIVQELLKDEMGFTGLTFTDALNMRGVTKFYQAGEVDVAALLAGNDILLFSQNLSKAIGKIKEAIEKGDFPEEELDRRVTKILKAKEWAGLNKSRFAAPFDIEADLHSSHARALKRKLYEQAMTVVKNRNNILPLNNLPFRKIAHVQIGGENASPFYQTARKYAAVSHFFLPGVADYETRLELLSKLKSYNTIIVTIEDMSKYSRRNYGLTTSTLKFMEELNGKQKNVALVLFGSPYSLRFFGHEDAIMVAYEPEKEAQIAAAEAIFGGIAPTGKLPVTASPRMPGGMGKTYGAADRIRFGEPDEVGMDAPVLNKIDSLAERAISRGGTPGCAVLVLRGNKIVYDKGFGETEYGNKNRVDPYNTIYDLASVTKISATTMATIRLVKENKIDIEESVSAYLSDFRNSNKAQIKVKNLLMHNAGLKSWIPFYTDTFDSLNRKQLDTAIYHPAPDARFCIPILKDLYMCVDYQDSIWMKIVNSKVRTDHKVVYSDLSMIIMGRIIEAVTGTTLDHYVDSVFYQPMGMNHTGFNPHNRGLTDRCAPTEMDTYWRKKKVHGYVHDQASAMMGGVAGHAGLFSNVYDLAKLLYMVKNGGSYGGKSYLDPALIKQFTSKQIEESRKGLGFDKPEMDSTKSSPCSEHASASAYGHLGFTGIGAWVDPEYDIVYLFFSNRTFPKSSNKILVRENYRVKIMDTIYESIFAFENRDTNGVN